MSRQLTPANTPTTGQKRRRAAAFSSAALAPRGRRFSFFTGGRLATAFFFGGGGVLQAVKLQLQLAAEDLELDDAPSRPQVILMVPPGFTCADASRGGCQADRWS